MKNTEPKKKKRYSAFTKELYIERYGMTEEEALLEVKAKRPTNPEYWERKGLTRDEAILAVKEHQKKATQRRTEKMKKNPEKYADVFPNQIKYWMKRGFSRYLAKKKVTEYQSTNSVTAIQKRKNCSLDEATVIRNGITKKWMTSLTKNDMDDINSKKSITLKSMCSKYGEKVGTKKYNKWMKSKSLPFTIDTFIKRHGKVIGTRKYDEYLAKNKGKFSVEWFISRYGEVAGTAMYSERLNNWVGNSTSSTKASKASLKIFIPLYKRLRKHGICRDDIKFGITGSTEHHIWTGSKSYFYDFTIVSHKLMFEFNGIAFHVNEDWNTERIAKWKHPFRPDTVSAEMMIEHEKNKITAANNNGFTVVRLWSDETNNTIWSKINDMLKNKGIC